MELKTEWEEFFPTKKTSRLNSKNLGLNQESRNEVADEETGENQRISFIVEWAEGEDWVGGLLVKYGEMMAM